MFKQKKKTQKLDLLTQEDYDDSSRAAKTENLQKKQKKKEFSTLNQKEEAHDRAQEIVSDLQYKSKNYLLLTGEGTATNENMENTEHELDAKAIAIRNMKISKMIKEGKLEKNVYRGQGVNTQFVDKTEEQIANAQYKGTLGPIRAPTNIRVTCNIDYNPSLCKDYHDTGYCVFGDSCIYIHDRGDYKNGFEMEKDWEREQKRRQNGGFDEDSDDDAEPLIEIPKICGICDKKLDNPIVTKCEHYFCEKCALKHYSKSGKCYTCHKPTQGIFNDARASIRKLKKQLKEQLEAQNKQYEESSNSNISGNENNQIEIEAKQKKDDQEMKAIANQFDKQYNKHRNKFKIQTDWGLL